jgi:L-asparaginase II
MLDPSDPLGLVPGGADGRPGRPDPAAGCGGSAFVPLLAFLRGGHLETCHRGLAVLADASGRVVWAAGDPEQLLFLRSAAKPFQAAAVITGGAADAFGITQEELAVMAASHAGQERHTRVVSGILARLGLTPAHLECGVHAPFDALAASRLLCAGAEPSPLQNNCSGKHAGMLALALALGVDPAGYIAAAHPVQQLVTQVVADIGGLDPSAIIGGTDGCGVPVFRLTALQTATMFARLAEGTHPALCRVRDAMLAYPELVGGEGRLDTRAMRSGRGGLVCKSGTGGLLGIGLVPGSTRARALGCCVKVADGSGAAMPFLLATLLRAQGLGEVADHVLGPSGLSVLNLHGEVVGRVDPLVLFSPEDAVASADRQS